MGGLKILLRPRLMAKREEKERGYSEGDEEEKDEVDEEDEEDEVKRQTSWLVPGVGVLRSVEIWIS